MQRTVNLIVIHCSATPNGKPIGPLSPTTGLPTLKPTAVIDGWHRDRGFGRTQAALREFNSGLSAIGYHYVIDLDGTVYPGRSLAEIPAQAKGFNAHAVGICLVGTSSYTPAQWRALAQTVLDLRFDLQIPLQSPKRRPSPVLSIWPMGYSVEGGVCGHRDLSPDHNGNGLIETFEYLKICPGFSVADWLDGRMAPLAGHILPPAAEVAQS